MRENFQAVLDRAGHGKHVVSLPAQPAIWTLRLLEQLHLSPIYKWIYDTAAQESFVSIERLESTLGIVPRYPNQDALIRNYDWYVLHRDEYKGRLEFRIASPGTRERCSSLSISFDYRQCLR